MLRAHYELTLLNIILVGINAFALLEKIKERKGKEKKGNNQTLISSTVVTELLVQVTVRSR